MKICACVAKKTKEECINLVKNIDADLIEHRMDYMEKIENLEDIYKNSKLPIIATNRSLLCGGNFAGDENDRIEYLFRAIDSECTMIDLEIGTETSLKKDLIEYAKSNDCGVIISFHDFEKTPKKNKLIEIMKKERREGADIGKIVTTANSMEECHLILEMLLYAKKYEFPLIAFSMGEKGRFTRIAACSYGAPFIYASVDERTGPGQISVEEMRRIWEVLFP